MEGNAQRGYGGAGRPRYSISQVTAGRGVVSLTSPLFVTQVRPGYRLPAYASTALYMGGACLRPPTRAEACAGNSRRCTCEAAPPATDSPPTLDFAGICESPPIPWTPPVSSVVVTASPPQPANASALPPISHRESVARMRALTCRRPRGVNHRAVGSATAICHAKWVLRERTVNPLSSPFFFAVTARKADSASRRGRASPCVPAPLRHQEKAFS